MNPRLQHSKTYQEDSLIIILKDGYHPVSGVDGRMDTDTYHVECTYEDAYEYGKSLMEYAEYLDAKKQKI